MTTQKSVRSHRPRRTKKYLEELARNTIVETLEGASDIVAKPSPLREVRRSRRVITRQKKKQLIARVWLGSVAIGGASLLLVNWLWGDKIRAIAYPQKPDEGNQALPEYFTDLGHDQF